MEIPVEGYYNLVEVWELFQQIVHLSFLLSRFQAFPGELEHFFFVQIFGFNRFS